jgi:cell division protease FtsH
MTDRFLSNPWTAHASGEKNQPPSPPRPRRRNPRQKPPDDQNIARAFRQLLLLVLLVVSVLIVVMFMRRTDENEIEVPYTTYHQFLDQGKIEAARIVKVENATYELHGTLRVAEAFKRNDGSSASLNHFSTRLGVLDSESEKVWREKGITITYDTSPGNWTSTWFIQILPWVGIFLLMFIFVRRMQQGGGGMNGTKGIFSFGKSKAKLWNEGGPKVTFRDVAGEDEAKEELGEIIEFLKEPSRFQRLGGKIPKGVLMLGPPGTGKTLLARAVAGEASVPFFSISGADFVEMFVGVGASRVRDLFEQAKRSSPCIIFIDEIDAVGRQRGAGLGGGHDEREQTLNQLLVEMDGFEQNAGVILIAATNRPDVLDPALLRPGRFDRQVVVDRPDVRGREEILKVHCRVIPVAADVELATIARGTPGMSGADLANLVNESALLAARENCVSVHQRHFEAAKDKVMMGTERRSVVISEEDKRRTAYHEIGHVLVSKFIPGGDPVHKVTIIPRGRALGLTAYLPIDEKHTYGCEYILGRIASLMGGRAAEHLIYNEFSTGASDDIGRATELARKMVCEWGMSDTLGPLAYGERDEEIFLGREITRHKNFSDDTARTIDSEIRRVVTEQWDRALTLLRENADTLNRLTDTLVERETLSSDEIDAVMRGDILPPRPPPVAPPPAPAPPPAVA